MAINKVANKGRTSRAAMRNVIEYVLQKDKIKDNLTYFSGPYEYNDITWDNVYKAFNNEKDLWGKNTGRLYMHHIISFPPNEKITPQEALDFAKEFVEKTLPEYQVLCAVHQDKSHTHIHLVANTVSYIDGNKLHQSKKDLQDMKDITNDMCLRRGLTVAQKGVHYDGTTIEKGEIISWEKNQYRTLINNTKKSYVIDCAKAVMDSIKSAINKETFIQKMYNKGWKTNWSDNRKYITFINNEGKKVRNSNIEKTFNIKCSKDELNKKFEENKMKINTTIDEPIKKNHLKLRY